MIKKINWEHVREKSEEWFRWCAFSCVVLSVMTIALDMEWNSDTKISYVSAVVAFATYNTFLKTGKECFMRNNKK